MNRTPLSMRLIEHHLKTNDYDVVNKGYPTSSYSVAQVSQKYIEPYVAQCRRKKPKHIHVVTHSIGGLLIRQYLKHHKLPKQSRIVMLAPPNHGSVMADRLQNRALYRSTMGRMGAEIRTGKQGITQQLPQQLPYEVGVITGNININAVSVGAFHGQSDGKVSVESAKLKGMSDFLVVPSSHTFIMMKPSVIKQISYFLENGHFQK